MTRLTLLLALLLLGCSSLPDKTYRRSKIEQQADQLVKTADNFRHENRIEEAKKYYQSAADLYRMKAHHDKYFISLLRLADLALKQNKTDRFDQLLKQLEMINQKEKLKQETAIDYLQVKRDYQNGMLQSANQRVARLIDIFSDDEERQAYYKFLRADHSNSANLSELEEHFEDLSDLYEDGELINVDIIIYAAMVRAKLAVKQNDSHSLQKLNQAESLFEKLELVGQLSQLYDLYVEFYQNKNDQSSLKYYQDKAKTSRELQKKYL